MDNRPNEISKKFEERNTTLTNQFNDFQKKIKHNSFTGAPFRKTAAKTQFRQEVETGEILGVTSAVKFEIHKTSTGLWSTSMAESKPKFLYAMITVISKFSATKLKFLLTTAIFLFSNSESKISKLKI